MLLLASIAALFIGPLLFQITRFGGRALGFFEGFTFITIAGLLCFSILPQAIVPGGIITWVFALLGLIFPVALERLFHRLARQVHLIILLLSVAGLVVHAAIDGAALALGSDAAGNAVVNIFESIPVNAEGSITLAVVLHRFPIGLAF